jgi:hypothetical protein
MVRPAPWLALAWALCVPPLFAAAPLFPQPLHLTRQVSDPISGSTTVLNEYGYGNRLVSVRGALTSIADYEKGELIEIDRDAGTYSITRFEAIAKAALAFGLPAAATERSLRHEPRSLGAKPTKAGRNAEFFQDEIDSKPMKQSIEVGVDRTVMVSREALEILLGSAYPGTRSSVHDVILSAAAANRASDATYALPVEQVIRYEVEGQNLEFRSTIVRVGNEAPPAELVSIPAGARLVVSRTVAVQREIDQFDHPTPPPPRRP